ncbi:MAG: hypothetical protein SFV21_09265 [Rhodospirillaceae bacterium]|nr:hypothetical protein [Rhodospirillaceae bacterium]
MASERGVERLLVVGSPASGKSEVARQMGELLKLPVHHLDSLFYLPGWVDQNDQRWSQTLNRVVMTDRWVIDGNFLDSLDWRLPRADAVIWLDYDRYETVRRVAGRMLEPHIATRDGLPAGCKESWSIDFLIFAWKFYVTQRVQLSARLGTLADRQTLVHITRPKDLRYFLRRYADRVRRRNLMLPGQVP